MYITKTKADIEWTMNTFELYSANNILLEIICILIQFFAIMEIHSTYKVVHLCIRMFLLIHIFTVESMEYIFWWEMLLSWYLSL